MQFNFEATPEEIQNRVDQLTKNIIQAPPESGKSWLNMTAEEQGAVRKYYDTHDIELSRGGTWVDPNLDLVTNFPDPGENYELDLGVVPKLFDENTRYSVVELRISFDREITQHQWDRLIWDLDEAVTNNGYPEFIMSAIVKSGTDEELFPEAYNESEESDGTGQEEMQ